MYKTLLCLLLIPLMMEGPDLVAQQPARQDAPASVPPRKEKHARRKAERRDQRKVRGEHTTLYVISESLLNVGHAQDLRAQQATMTGPGIQFNRGVERLRAKSLMHLKAGAGYTLLIPSHGASQTHSIGLMAMYSYQRPCGTFRGMNVYAGGAVSLQNTTRISPSLENSALANDFIASLGVQGSLTGPLDLWLFKPVTDVSLRLPLFSWAMRTPRYSFSYLDLAGHRFGPMGVVTPIHAEVGMRFPFSRWHQDTNPNRTRIAYVWDMYHVSDPLTPVVFATHSLSLSLLINREYHEQN